MTPFERVLLVHEGTSSSASLQEAELTTSPPFLQQNRHVFQGFSKVDEG
jgi:hypothetical protein